MAKAYNNYSDIIDFTRASSGTALRPVSYSDELVTNGTFDTDVSGWSDLAGTSTYSSGTLQFTSSAGAQGAYQSFSTITGKVYRAEATSTSASISHLMRVHNTAAPSSGAVIETAIAQTSPSTFVVIFVAQSDTSNIYLRSGEAGVVNWDNVSIKEVIFDQADAPLTLFNHPTNIPRIEYDADGNRLGLLVEEQRTNLVTYSEDFSNSAWSKYYSLSVSESSEISPDKNQNAYEISGIESTDGDLGLTDVVSITPSTTYSLSIWVKAANQSDIGKYIKLRSKRNGGAFIAEDNIIQLSNEWVRHSLTLTFLADNNAASFTITRSSTTPLAERSDSCLIYGAQLEAGSFPTSYIPTSGAAATRSADVASVDVTDFGYNQSEGSVIVEAQSKEIGVNRLYALTEDGGIQNAIYSYAGSSGHLIVRANNVTEANIDAGTFVANTYSKLAATYNTDNCAVTIDGGSVQTDTSANLPTTVNTLFFGASSTTASYLNGHIKSIKYYPRALTAAQLQEITS